MPKINNNELATNTANGLAKLDGSAKVPVANLPTNTANGVAGLDASGLLPTSVLPSSLGSTIKTPVRVATTAALAACTYSSGAKTLTANANGALASIDAISLSVGERLLVKDQATGTQNGIYVVTSLGGVSSTWVLTRASDMTASSDLASGAQIAVISGTTYSATEFILTTTGTLTLDTTALAFTRQTVTPTSTTGMVTYAGGSNGIKIQAGQASNSTGTGSVTFSPAFSTLIGVTCTHDATSFTPSLVAVQSASAGGFSFVVHTDNGSSAGGTVNWIAVGT